MFSESQDNDFITLEQIVRYTVAFGPVPILITQLFPELALPEYLHYLIQNFSVPSPFCLSSYRFVLEYLIVNVRIIQ